jgi:hypothetical protein
MSSMENQVLGSYARNHGVERQYRHVSGATTMRLFRKRSECHTFWAWLAANTARIKSHDKRALRTISDEISKAFHSTYPGLVWEISPADSQPWLFCVSADGKRDLFPAVSHAVRTAPDIAGWKVQAFRPRGYLNGTIHMDGHKLRYEDIWCSVDVHTEGFGVTLYIAGLSPETDEALGGAAILLLDDAVGEYDAVMKIAELHRRPLPANPVRRADYFPLAELPQYLDDVNHQ